MGKHEQNYILNIGINFYYFSVSKVISSKLRSL